MWLSQWEEIVKLPNYGTTNNHNNNNNNNDMIMIMMIRNWIVTIINWNLKDVGPQNKLCLYYLGKLA